MNTSKLPFIGDQSSIPKEHAWIVWLCDDNRRITDLQVYNLGKDPVQTNYDVRNAMAGVSFYDCGCVNDSWRNWLLEDLLYKFGWQYGFANPDIMKQTLASLQLISEFREGIMAMGVQR